MKIIYDNIIFALQNTGGISVVWHELINWIGKNKNYKITIVDYVGTNRNIFSNMDFKPYYILKRKIGFLAFNRFFNISLKEKEPFIFHSSIYRTSNNSNAYNVVTVHDFIYEKYRKGLALWLHHWRKRKSLNKAKVIICISENTKKDMLKYFPKIASKEIKVVYNGVSNEYYQLKTTPYKNFYNSLLFIGKRDGYKNFHKAVELISSSKFELIIVGGPLNNKEKIFLEKFLPNRYQIKTHIDNQELNKIYNSVYALIYPSEYEGFGIPILEAQKSGCPVIALNTSSITEIIGNDYPTMKAFNEVELKRIINSINEERQQIVNKGIANSKKFSWQKMAKEYDQIYQEILNKHIL